MLGGAVINTVASQQQGLRFESPGDRGAFLCLHVVCVASLRVPRPPPEVQRHAFEGMAILNGRQVWMLVFLMSWGHVQTVL